MHIDKDSKIFRENGSVFKAKKVQSKKLNIYLPFSLLFA